MKFPKLRSTQWLGLAAILVFGGRLIFMLLEGPRDPDVLPSGVRISDLPTPSDAISDPFAPPAKPLEVGSQEARDMLYCSGVISAESKAKPDAPMEESLPRFTAALALANAGRAKLEAEGAVKGFGAISVDTAWGDKAGADYKDGKLAIPLPACMKIADALPPPPPDPNAPPPVDHTAQGSQAARDDLYCAGVISTEFDARKDQHPDEMSKQIAAMRALDEAGLAKLRSEGVANKDNGATFSLAHVDKAKVDHQAGKPRIAFDACMARAATVPPAPN
jgi:hypothetical protein